MNNRHDLKIMFWLIVLMLVAGCGGKKTEQTITVPSPPTESTNTYLEQRYYEDLLQKERALKESLANRRLDPLTRNIIEDLRMMNISLIQIIVRQMQEDNAHLKALLESDRKLLQSELTAKEERYRYLLEEFVKVLPKQAIPPNPVHVPKPPTEWSRSSSPLHGYPKQFSILIEIRDYKVENNWLSLPRDKEVTWIGERYEGRIAISIVGTPFADVYEITMPMVEDGFEWVTAHWKGRRN